jgi:hypothetical protein
MILRGSKKKKKMIALKGDEQLAGKKKFLLRERVRPSDFDVFDLVYVISRMAFLRTYSDSV